MQLNTNPETSGLETEQLILAKEEISPLTKRMPVSTPFAKGRVSLNCMPDR